MPKEQPHGRAQTIKQAKAAFKARGPTAVSSAERRQLERGAVLLERAARLKEQDQRRKLLAKKRDEHPQKEKPVLLGTQVKLDKFGHKSSQFHLGAFVKVSRPQPVPQKGDEESKEEPWDDEDVDDDTLLDIAAKSAVQHKPNFNATIPMTGTRPAPKAKTPNRKTDLPVYEDLSDWDDFLDSSTQLARELSSEGPARPPQVAQTNGSKPRCRIPSFTSPDFDLDLSNEDLEALESNFAQPLQRPPPLLRSSSYSTSDLYSNSKSTPTTTLTRPARDRKSMPLPAAFPPTRSRKESTLVPPPKLATASKSMPPPSLRTAAKLMPPPPPRLLARPLKQSTTTRITKSKYAPPPATTINMPPGISLADLESLAAENIQLTQYGVG